ncbi:FAD-dependent oxidoreductase [Sphingomonas bacterium]|uniref:FAD-dependent oxidoreductase n=1 Tax=Sphingomonas bacterium TaxID=1895847 RepID=UPI001575A01A|nr:FAD-dependent oxidoreductase [Sphingomonas bacterium]
MRINQYSLTSRAEAERIEQEYWITDGLYLLGSVAQGLTVFDQQVRAHNLAWALWRLLEGDGPDSALRVAIIGGGIAGLTVAACLLARSRGFHITLFEERWDLCPLQQGSDTRWVHPHIYRWPEHGSRAPDAGLPVLNWTEGRASDVARDILEGFGRYADEYGTDRLDLVLGLSHLRIDATDRSIEWMGRSGIRSGPHVRAGDADGARRPFDVMVLATGFGLEEGVADAAGASSYWRNDRLGQPQLGGDRRTYVISGLGDGALVDLCRLTIERFRQDTILYELFEDGLEAFEDDLRTLLDDDFGRTRRNVHDLFERDLPLSASAALDLARERLRGRLRKDTHVVLHARGRDNNKSIRDLFDGHSSFLNRMLLYLLYRCGGFVLSLRELAATTAEFAVPPERVVVRHGASTIASINALFSDPLVISEPVQRIKDDKLQAARRGWPLGAFPSLEVGA